MTESYLAYATDGAESNCLGPQRQKAWEAINHTGYLLPSYPVECYYVKKSFIYLCLFFVVVVVRIISKDVEAAHGKMGVRLLHASPAPHHSLSLFTTYIRWHCSSGWFY